MDEARHENYVNPIISIRHNCFGITLIRQSTSWKFHPKVHSCSMVIQIFHLFVTFIHVDVVFIQHDYFGINSIHTFQHVEFFIQVICQLVIIIQKFIDV